MRYEGDGTKAADHPPEAPADLAYAVSAGELGTFYCDWPLDKIIWNDKCKEHFFLPPDAEVDLKLFYSILHPDDREPTRTAIELAQDKRMPYNAEYRTCGPDGAIRWINAVGRFSYDDTGKPVRFDGITIDITRRKQVEQQLLKRIEQESILNRIGKQMRATLDIETIQWTAVEELGRALAADRCYFSLYMLDTDTLWIGTDYRRHDLPSLSGEYRISHYQVNPEDYYPDGRTLVVCDVVEDAWKFPDSIRKALADLRVRSGVAVPYIENGKLVATLTVAMADEARRWSGDDVAFIEAVATQTRSAIEAARMFVKEHAIAERLQSALQPPIPSAVPGLELAYHYRAALDEAEVGGDFADVFSDDNARTFLVVGDLAGKGLAAAPQVSSVRYNLRYALYNAATISDAITHLNRTVARHALLSGFATLYVGLYDPILQTFSYVNCGQDAAILLRSSGQSELLGPTGPVFGMTEHGTFDEVNLQLRPGDTIAIFTDGLTEIGPSRTRMLGLEGLLEIAKVRANAADLAQITRKIISDVVELGRGIVRDDQCMLMLRIVDAPELAAESTSPNYCDSPEHRLVTMSNLGERMLFLDQTVKSLATAGNAKEVAKITVEACVAALGATAGSIAMLCENGQELQTIHCQGYPEEITAAYQRFPVETRIPHADAVRMGEAIYIETLAERDGRYPHLASNSRHLKRGAAIGLPLTANAELLGGLSLSFPHDRSFGEDDKAFLNTLAQMCIQILATRQEMDDRRAADLARMESDARHATVVDAALDCIITIDVDETVLEWNKAAETTFGYSSKEAIGHSLSTLIIPERLRHAHKRGIAHFLATGEGPALFKRLEVPATKSNGEEITVELTAIPIKLGDTYNFTAYVRDISDRERLMAQRRTLMRDMLLSVTGQKLTLCQYESELPPPLSECREQILLSVQGGLAQLRQCGREAMNAIEASEERRNDFVTAISEAGMNAIIHGGGGRGQLCFDVSEGRAQVRIMDSGGGIEMDKLPNATLSRGYSTSSTLGHGLKMIIELVDRVYLMTGPAGTTIVFEQDRVTPLPAWLNP